VSKKKILIDIGAVPAPPKQNIVKLRSKHNLPPDVHSLVKKYFMMKEMKEV
jgi:hypothetical protein